MAGRKPAKPEIPETPFGALGSSPGEGSGQRLGTSRLNSRESDRPSRQPPIYEDQEQRQQPREKLPQYFSSIDSDRQRGSQLGSKESLARTPEFPSKATTRASSAGSRCPFLPCHGCVEHCLDTKDAQQHYRPSWVCHKSQLCFETPFTVFTKHLCKASRASTMNDSQSSGRGCPLRMLLMHSHAACSSHLTESDVSLHRLHVFANCPYTECFGRRAQGRCPERMRSSQSIS